jgi:NRAMP (natural resistance-associated macrophage protein)-like metal ion transporter
MTSRNFMTSRNRRPANRAARRNQRGRPLVKSGPAETFRPELRMTVHSAPARSSVVGPSKPRLLSVLGPGLISGASDDDPTAIATYSQAGAKFGYQLGWLSLLCFPIMAVVQEVSGRIGRTTGQGLAANIRRHYPPWLLLGCVLLLLCANIVAIGADLGAMADVVRLLVGGPHLLYVVLFGALCIGMQIFMAYTRYVAILKWTTLSLLAYFAAALLANVSWSDVLRGFWPRLSLDRDWITTVVAIFGVAISPYIFFWQSAQEAEDQRVKPKREPLVEAPEQAPAALERIRLDTWVGMAVATLVGLAIMVTTAATLHAQGVTDVQSSAQAAEALRPVAGGFAFGLFALGIIGTGLLAVPVLAGSAAYAIGEARRWRVGLAREPDEAKSFYATLAFAGAVGVAFNFAGVDPMRALYWSAVVNGVVAVPVLALMMLMASRASVMGDFTIGLPLRIVGWAAVGLMGLSVAAMLVFTVL